MSSGRLKYDECAYAKTLYESTGPFKYITNPVSHIPSMQCTMEYPGFNTGLVGNQGINPNAVDVESELRDQTRYRSKCPVEKYTPYTNCKVCENCDQGLPCGCFHCVSKTPFNLEDCSKEIVPIQTRSFNACGDLNGIFINRFQPLCNDPQALDQIHSNEYIGADTRHIMKDYTANKYNYKEMANDPRNFSTFKPCDLSGVSFSSVDDYAQQLPVRTNSLVGKQGPVNQQAPPRMGNIAKRAYGGRSEAGLTPAQKNKLLNQAFRECKVPSQ